MNRPHQLREEAAAYTSHTRVDWRLGRSCTGVLALASVALAGLCLVAQPAAAQAKWPSKPIQIIVPYPPGGSNDVFARAMAQRLAEPLGRPVVVENRPGGGGVVGANAVANANPDGHTLAYVSSSFTTSAAVQATLPFDPVKSFAPVALVGKGPFVIVVNNNLPVKTLRDLIALARSQPGKLNYATSGVGSSNQFAAELLASVAGVKFTHIPYKGMGPATNDLMGGHVDMIFGSIPSVMQIARAGKVRALAVTSDGPSPLAPELPAANAQGAPGYVFDAWSGVLAPANTPREVVTQLNAEINRILMTTEMKDFLHREGIMESPSTPAQFGALITEDITRWKKLATDLGIKGE